MKLTAYHGAILLLMGFLAAMLLYVFAAHAGESADVLQMPIVLAGQPGTQIPLLEAMSQLAEQSGLLVIAKPQREPEIPAGNYRLGDLAQRIADETGTEWAVLEDALLFKSGELDKQRDRDDQEALEHFYQQAYALHLGYVDFIAGFTQEQWSVLRDKGGWIPATMLSGEQVRALSRALGVHETANVQEIIPGANPDDLTVGLRSYLHITFRVAEKSKPYDVYFEGKIAKSVSAGGQS